MINVMYDNNRDLWRSTILYKGKYYYLVASKNDKEKCQRILDQAIEARENGNFEKFYNKLKERRRVEEARKNILYNSIEYEYCKYEDNSYMEDFHKNEYICQPVKESNEQAKPERVRKSYWKKEFRHLALDFGISENKIEEIIKDAECFCGLFATGTALYNRAWANMLTLI